MVGSAICSIEAGATQRCDWMGVFADHVQPQFVEFRQGDMALNYHELPPHSDLTQFAALLGDNISETPQVSGTSGHRAIGTNPYE